MPERARADEVLRAVGKCHGGASLSAAHGEVQTWTSLIRVSAVDGPCAADGCALTLRDGRFRGAPAGSGACTGAFKIKVARAFPNGDGGICAPINGRIVLGAGTANRLVLGVHGDSCQDGTGFSGLAHFTVKRGTGRYADAYGSGLASLTEDAAKHHRIALIGRIDR